MEAVKAIVAAASVVGFACVLLFFAIIAAEAHQPQPRVEVISEDWGFLEFESGAQWYFDETKISAVHTIPAEDARKLGYKVVIYGPGWKIYSPYTMAEIEQRVITGGKAPFKKPVSMEPKK